MNKLNQLNWPDKNSADNPSKFVDRLITVFNDIQAAPDLCNVKKPAKVIPSEKSSINKMSGETVSFIVIGVIIGLLVVLFLGGYAFFTIRNRRRVTRAEEDAVNRNVYTVMD